MKMPYYPQSLVQLNANKVGLVQIRPEQHRGRNSGSDEGGEYRISAVEEEILIWLRIMTYCSVGWWGLPLLENPYCPDEPVVVGHQAGWMI